MGETTVLHLPFAGGLDELVSKEYLDASARQSSILNGDFAKAGSISKRAGLEYLSTDVVSGALPAPTAGVRVVGWSRSSLSLIGSGKFYQHTKAPVGEGEGGLTGAGLLPNVGVVRRPVATDGAPEPPTFCDLTYSGHLLRVSIFRNPYDLSLYGRVDDVEDGSTVQSTETGFQATYVVAAFALPNAPGGPIAIIVFHDTISGAVTYATYNPATNAFGGLVTMVAGDVTTVDAAPYEDDPANGWLLLYDVGGTGGAPGDEVRLAYWTLEGQQAFADEEAAPVGYALRGGAYVCGRYGRSVWSIWKYDDFTDEIKYVAQRRVADTSLNTATSPYVFESIIADGVPGSLTPTGLAHLGTDKVFVSFRIKKTGDGVNWGTFLSGWRVLSHSAGTVSSLAVGQIPQGLIAATKPFVVEGEVYQPFIYNLNHEFVNTTDADYKCRQPALYLCKFYGVSDSMPNLGTIKPNKCLPVATVAPRQVSTAYQERESADRRHLGFPSSVERTARSAAVGINTISPGDVNLESGWAAWAVDFLFGADNERGLYQPSELGSELSLSAGVPFVSDGRSAFEDGFFNYPEFTRAEIVEEGSPFSGDAYAFAVVYRAMNAAGLVQRSAPCMLAPVTVPSGHKPVLHILPVLGSYRDAFATIETQGKVFAEVYMTTANGASFFYHGSISVSNIWDDSSDPPWLTSVAYKIDSPPLDGAPLLYTTGGVLDHVNPPASSSQITHQKRKALVDETRQGVWLSKQFSPGLAPGFNEGLYIDFPEEGDIVALGSLDARLVAFKQSSIWYVDGQGPSPNGLGASWTDPERLPSNVGCKSWQSVVSIPIGLLFQGSDNGIYLLGRDSAVSFIGKNVVDSTNDFPNIVSAALVPSSNHVRFVCLDEAGMNHLVIVYDYLLNAWTTHRYDHVSDVPVSICVSAGMTPRYTVLSADGRLWQERGPSDPQRYLDEDDAEGTHFVPTVIKMPFVKLQVQGYHRARRVQFYGERLDDCGFQIQMAFNYDDTVKQTATWAASQLNSLSVKGQVEAYVGAAFNKQMSMQLTFSDTAGTAMGTGAGMRFVSAAIELQTLGSRYKLLGAGARR